MAGAALWRLPSSFRAVGAALQTCRVACFWRIALSGLRETQILWQACDFVRDAGCDENWRKSHETSILRQLSFGFVKENS